MHKLKSHMANAGGVSTNEFKAGGNPSHGPMSHPNHPSKGHDHDDDHVHKMTHRHLRDAGHKSY